MANELILIVEDDPRNLKLLRDTLQVKGYRTVEAVTGEEGGRADPTNRIMPVVAVTALAHRPGGQKAAGFDEFQGTPSSVRELLGRKMRP